MPCLVGIGLRGHAGLMARRASKMSAADLRAMGRRIDEAIVAAGFVRGLDLPNRLAFATSVPALAGRYQKLAAWCRGEVEPELTSLRDLAAALSVSADWILFGHDPDVAATVEAWKAARRKPVAAGFDAWLRKVGVRGVRVDARWLEWQHTGYVDGLTPDEGRTVGRLTRAADSAK